MTDAAATRPPARRQAYGLAIFAGILHFLGWAGFGIWPLGLVCMVPFWIALELGLERPWRHALGLGWVYGAVSYLGGYHWLVEFLDVFSGYGLFGSAAFFLAFCVYLGFDYALYAVLYRALRRRGFTTAAVAIPAYAGYNYLVARVNSIVIDMEKSSTEILNLVSSLTLTNGK